MKKFYSTLVLAILALAGFQASAVALTVTVKVNDPSLCRVYPYWYPGGTQPDLVFDDQNEAYVEYPDGTYAAMRYLYMVPVTPEGQPTTYVKTIKVYDCDGELIAEKGFNATTQKSYALPVAADGGYVDIEFGPLGKQSMNVDIVGDPAKVKISFDQNTVSNLVEGTQKIEFEPGTKYLTIYPQGGLTELYRVTYNGAEQTPRSADAEGEIIYYYMISGPQDGASLKIETDFPDVDYTVMIVCNEPGFINHISVNGVDQPIATSFTVKAGDNVNISGDAFNYKVLECAINGTKTAAASSSITRVIKADTEFSFTVEKIVRNLRYVAYVGNAGDTWLARTATSQNVYLKEGYTTVPLTVSDNPVDFSVYSTSQRSEDALRYVFVNDEEVTSDFASYYLNLADNDVVKLYYTVPAQAPELYDVAFTLEGFTEPLEATKDLITAVADAAEGFKALPGTLVSFSAPTNVALNEVMVNGTVVEPVDGSYTLTVDGPTEVIVRGASSGIAAVAADADANSLRVFNAQGILLRNDGNTSNLPAGLYIVGGKKIIVK